jgi:hypothetical protein
MFIKWPCNKCSFILIQIYVNRNLNSEITGSHSGKDVDCGLLCCDTEQYCGSLPTFQANVGNRLQDYIESQHRRPQSTQMNSFLTFLLPFYNKTYLLPF